MEEKPEILTTELHTNNLSDPHVKLKLSNGVQSLDEDQRSTLISIVTTIVNLVLGIVFRK